MYIHGNYGTIISKYYVSDCKRARTILNPDLVFPYEKLL